MYWWSVEDLYRFLDAQEVLSAGDRLRLFNYREVAHGRLPIGMKLHALSTPKTMQENRRWQELFEALTARWVDEKGNVRQRFVLRSNSYRLTDGSLWCFILPPLGTPESAVTLFRALERFIDGPIFSNPAYQFQLCVAGKLEGVDAALLAILFYLSSDTLRDIRDCARETTFSIASSRGPECDRGVRMVLYGVADGTSTFDCRFPWWGRTLQDGVPHILKTLPFRSGGERTDILAGSCSPADLERFNLISTLLVHARYDGYWRSLGEAFKEAAEYLLAKRDLAHLLKLPWVHDPKTTDRDALTYHDKLFVEGLQELVAVALEERQLAMERPEFLPQSLLSEACALVDTYAHLAKTEGGDHVW